MSRRSRVVEVARLDDQRVALPAATGIAQPLPNLRLNVRTAVGRDDPYVVIRLHDDRQIPGALEEECLRGDARCSCCRIRSRHAATNKRDGAEAEHASRVQIAEGLDAEHGIALPCSR